MASRSSVPISSFSSRPAPRRRALRWALNAAIALGILIALSPAFQHAFGWWSQRRLMAAWNSSAPASASTRSASARHSDRANTFSALASHTSTKKGRAARTAAKAESVVAMGGHDAASAAPWPPTRLRIPDIGVDAIVVQGLDAQALAEGPGHEPSSGLPGEGNCVLAAHRNVYGAWFYRLDELMPGSIIELSSGGQTYRYSVVGLHSVSETDSSILRQPPPGTTPSIHLYTCTLPHSPFRIVATAYMQRQ